MDYKRRLSVIVPGYNTPKEWWVRCVTSIARALTNEDEIIVVDDGSAVPVEREWFDSILHLHLAPTPIHIIRHAKNLGLPSGRNSGLDAAQGRFVTFVDSDDEILPGAFDQCIAKLEEHTADVAVYGIRSVYLADKFQVLDMPEGGFYGALTPTQVAQLVKKRLFYYSCNKVFRRAFIDEHHMRFNPEGVPQEDAIFNVGLVVNKAKWVGVAVEGYRYYRYDGSIVSRYQPTLIAGTRACTKAWRDYKAMTPGAVEEMAKYGLGWYDETSEDELTRREWMNIWRRGTPYGARAQYRFAKEHAKVLGSCTPLVFLKQAISMFVRRYLYIAPIRRRHQKAFLTRIGARIFPLEEGKNG